MKLKQPFKTTEKTVHYKTDEYKLVDDVRLVVNHADGVITSQHITKSKKVKLDGEWQYNYFYVKDIDEFKNKCKETLFYTENPKNKYWWWEHIVTDDKYLEEFTTNGFDPEKLVIIHTYDHTFRDRHGEIMDMLIAIDYVSGFRQKAPDCDYSPDWKWNELVKHLSNHPSVKTCKEELIPYYNSEFGGQMGLYLEVRISSEWSNKKSLQKWYDKGQFLIGEMDGLDPLNVNQFKIPAIKTEV